MKVNLSAIMNFAGEVQSDKNLARKTKTVSGTCNFADGQPHFEAVLEFPKGKATLPSDQPPFMGGGGLAPDPILYCLYGTASCFAGTMMLIIAQRNLKVDSLKVSVQNKLNLLKPLGLGEAPLVEGVTISLEYSGAATQREMDEAVAEAMETCPGAYCLKNPILTSAEIKKA
ncbi:OsmC family protein [bacterium]|nr:OsmC family protein [bacterium]MBU1983457.1 OsmC family protein [bacterium]